MFLLNYFFFFTNISMKLLDLIRKYMPKCIKIREQFIKQLLEGNKDEAVKIIKDWSSNNSYQEAVVNIIEPTLDIFGREWDSGGQVSIGQGYILSKAIDEIFLCMTEERKKSNETKKKKGNIVIGNIMDDSHGLGRKLVISFLEINNWNVFDLGNDVLPITFIEEALEKRASIIAVSAMMYRTAINIKKIREEIDNRNLKDTLKLAVGGAVFCQRPELVHEVGGDGTAPNAILAPQLFDKLIGEFSGK